MFLEQLPQQLVNGIILGSIYALLALGYTMVYGIIKLIMHMAIFTCWVLLLDTMRLAHFI